MRGFKLLRVSSGSAASVSVNFSVDSRSMTGELACELFAAEPSACERVGDPVAKGSRLKKVHFLVDLVGLGVAGPRGSAGGSAPRKGMDPLLFGDRRARFSSSSWVVKTRSRTAPAVLGRLSLNLGVELNPNGEFSSRSPVESDMREEILPETEWPGRAVAVLEASLETRESGRGMYSSVSENPTLARATGFAGRSSSGETDDVFSFASVRISGSGRGVDSGTGDCWSRVGKSFLAVWSGNAGLDGALFPLTL